jgi:hypothetical protein
MTDNQTAQARVGSIFNYVLIASERMKEIYEERRSSGEAGMSIEQYKTLELPHLKAAREIESGLVGREYLERLGRRGRQTEKRMR